MSATKKIASPRRALIPDSTGFIWSDKPYTESVRAVNRKGQSEPERLRTAFSGRLCSLRQEFVPLLLAGVGQLLDLGDLQRLNFLLAGRHGSGDPNLLAIVPEQGIVVTLEPEHAAVRREREMSVHRSHATFNGDRSASCSRVIAGSPLTGGRLLSEPRD